MVINRFIKGHTERHTEKYTEKHTEKHAEKHAERWVIVMNIKECYDSIGADFEDVLGRLGSEKLIERFALKFLDDDIYNNLKEALAEKNAENAFRAAHTLKGVCLNLGLKNLYTVSSDLTEKLRGRSLDGADELFEKVREQYDITVNALKNVG